ncbi:agmatinase [Nanobdella aerobiophila]|uniref:Agmatinase n=1 Tax=Nanobdella aerobiophila TaxID=2586965 RepID=A0A915S9U5_9ARCH|nr:arginase family protein [Nanobdella aerobiophila]BBL45277.1 agmatinase [Nanobdella aerobiophila]
MFAHAKGNKNSKWKMIGIPSEVGSLSNIKFYSNGPKAIRDASYKVFDTLLGDIDLEDIEDLGDIDIEDIRDINYLYNYIYNRLKEIYDKNKKYIFLGGDHSITYPILKLIRENWNNYKLLYFDAHPDMHPDPYPNYESYIYYLIKEEYLNPEDIIMVGISNLSFEEKNILKDWNIKYYNFYEVWDNINDISREISNILDNKNLYISIDIDVFENGCGHWLEGMGIKVYHYLKILKELKNVHLIGFDLTELFSSNICNNLAVKIILETISIFNYYK